ncbi:MAG: hypothetical protein IH945_09830 [Armatimonadetes bacterium]|nr:hypothetical protein [Armatimonadota bacterium]
MVSTLLLSAAMLVAPIDTPTTPAELAFDRFKSMEGAWAGEASDGRKIKYKIEVIAAGSVVMVTSDFDAHPGERMVTLFRMDQARLILTHYCVAKNQPRLEATRYENDGKKVHFTFESATNLKSRNQGHMDSAIYDFVDDDTFRSKWTWYQDGKETWMESFTLRRQKG